MEPGQCRELKPSAPSGRAIRTLAAILPVAAVSTARKYQVAWPGLSILSLAYLVGYWAIISGVLAIVTAMRLRKHVGGEWFYLLFGIVSVIFGGFVLFAPATGLVYIVLMISIYGFVIGVTMIALAFRARSLPA